VLTGATGSLGAHILSKLVAASAVRKIICLSRADSHANSLERVRQSLQSRKIRIDVESKVEAYASNPNTDLLGLTQQEYDQIQNEATIVIHVCVTIV
jgi:thioester reductase-like protein